MGIIPIYESEDDIADDCTLALQKTTDFLVSIYVCVSTCVFKNQKQKAWLKNI